MFDLSGYIGDIARRLLGEPNRALSTKTQLRFGSNGSIAVEIAGARRGRWYDHEHGIGGGPWEMLRIKGGFANGQAEKWLRDNLGIETRPKTNGADSSQRQRQRQHILKTYDYHDEEGALLFKVDRWGPKKTFTQRAPDGNGGWTKGKGAMKGVRRVPYRLPHLVAAMARANGTPWRVYIPEGEKDVDNLVLRWGVTATTNPMGAGKWLSQFNRHFIGSDAVIIADNDEAGRAHVARVAAELSTVASIVRVVERLGGLDENGDISDWIASGASQSDLETLVEITEPFRPSRPANVQNRSVAEKRVDLRASQGRMGVEWLAAERKINSPGRHEDDRKIHAGYHLAGNDHHRRPLAGWHPRRTRRCIVVVRRRRFRRYDSASVSCSRRRPRSDLPRSTRDQ